MKLENFNIDIYIKENIIARANTLTKRVEIIKENSDIKYENDFDGFSMDVLGSIVKESKNLNLTIVLGYMCNMNCKYCYESKNVLHDETSLDTKLLFEMVNKLNDSVNFEKINFEFYGGEPLLYYDQIIVISRIFSQGFKNFSFSIMTNGTLLTRDRIIEMRKFGLKKIEISIDGTQKYHNILRPQINGKDSFNILINNIENFSELISIVIRVNVDNGNISKIPKLLCFLSDKNLKRKIHIYFTNIIECSSTKYDDLNFYEQLGELYYTAILNDFMLPFKLYSIGPCHNLRRYSAAILPNGKIVKCIAIKDSEILHLNSFENMKSYNLSAISCEDTECSMYPICYGGCEYSNAITKSRCPKSSLEIINKRIIQARVEKAIGL